MKAHAAIGMGILMAPAACGSSEGLGGPTAVLTRHDAGPAGEGGSSIDAGAPTSTTMCPQDSDVPTGATVVACGFPPDVQVLGVDGEAVYAVTLAGEYYRVDKTTQAKTLLYSDPSLRTAYTQSQLQGDRIYFWVSSPSTALATLVAITTAGSSAPVAIGPTAPYEGPAFGFVLDETNVYWGTDDSVMRYPLAGGAPAPVLASVGYPVVSRDGFLYSGVPPSGTVYPPYGQLVRVPTTGGASSVVIPAIDSASGGDIGEGAIAVGPDAAYVLGATDATGEDPLERYPLAGGAPVLLAEIPQPEGEVPLGPPTSLCFDDGYLYFAQDLAGDHPPTSWYRVADAPGAANGQPEFLIEGTVMGVPAFDAAFFYLAYQRGGVTDPLEGVILRLPK